MNIWQQFEAVRGQTSWRSKAGSEGLWRARTSRYSPSIFTIGRCDESERQSMDLRRMEIAVLGVQVSADRA